MRVSCDKTARKMRRFNDFVRGELRRKKLKHKDLAEYLNINTSAVTQKLSGDHSWTGEQMLDTIEFLEADAAEIFS